MPAQSLPSARFRRAVLFQPEGITLVVIIFLFVGIRCRLSNMPLERDEGEYALAGQQLLQGIPPYRDVFNMKLPGSYFAYAGIMAVFGQTPSGIHLGLALVNSACIILIFFLARHFFDRWGSVVASASFASLSNSPSLLGLAGHATHFIVFLVLAGALMILRTENRSSALLHLLSGASFGLAFLMKQHALMFVLFGFAYLCFCTWQCRNVPGFRSRLVRVGLFALAASLPYALTCLWLVRMGVWKTFFFWTFTYAGKYGSSQTSDQAFGALREAFLFSIKPDLLLWLLPLAGLLCLWVGRYSLHKRLFISKLLLFSLGAASLGFYFRDHYFLMVLPALALLTAQLFVAIRSLLQLSNAVRFTLGLVCSATLLLAYASAFWQHGKLWFSLSPTEASYSIYGTTIFEDTRKISEIINQRFPTLSSKIAVIGSEPQIYFYTKRPPAQPYIYMYPLMEPQPFARQMQKELIQKITAASPQTVVFIEEDSSWLGRPDSEKIILDWWNYYSSQILRLVETVHGPPIELGSQSSIYVFTQKLADR
jgi:hypothetical protein